MPSVKEDYSTLEKGVGLFVLPQAVLRFQGPDRHNFLQGALTNDLKNLEKGRGLAALHLSTKGKWVASLKLFEKENGVWVFTSSPEKETLQAALKTLIFFSKTQLTDLSSDYLWILGLGREALSFAAEAFQWKVDQPPLSHREFILDGIPIEIIRDFDWGLNPAFLILAPRSEGNRIQSALLSIPASYPVRFLGEDIYPLLRIEAGIPDYGVDVDSNTLPQEAVLEKDYISYTKGCYIGQETVSRVHHLGHVNKKLVRLKLETSIFSTKLPAPVFFGEKEVGRVTSAALSPKSDRVIALGTLRSEAIETNKNLMVKMEGQTISAILM